MTTITVTSPSLTQFSSPSQSQQRLFQQPPMEKEREAFPSFEDIRPENKPHPVLSPQQISPVNAPPINNWPARKSSRTGWETRNGGGLHTHRSKRSVGEAFDNLRQRRGSISANTQELAEALKAPISYKLIVSSFPGHSQPSTKVDIYLGALYHLVHDIGAHQYILKIYTECLSETRYPDHCTICLCITMVSCLCLLGFRLSCSEDSYSSSQERY